MTAGVEVDATFRASGEVLISATPSGRAATATHIGPYAAIAHANDAIAAWCHSHGETLAGPSWEVYGDWDEDESRLQTDVYYLLR